MAAPMAAPVNPSSEIGITGTRSGPNSSTKPTVGMVQKRASSQKITTLGSRRISSSMASRRASR